uniref:Uncharacterized protein n=1 Tax=Loa loa TaxID=7209 RepID=A0A1I7VMA9_LOALO
MGRMSLPVGGDNGVDEVKAEVSEKLVDALAQWATVTAAASAAAAMIAFCVKPFATMKSIPKVVRGQ